MNDSIDDATAEELLAGRVGSAGLEPVATVVQALREVSTQPVRPSPALRAQMAAGAFPGTPVHAYRPPTARTRLRRLLVTVPVAVATSLVRARLVTKLAAAGLAATVLSFGTAGFAGSLPSPVQDSFESVVESVSPYQFPENVGDPGGGRVEPAGGPEDPVPPPASPSPAAKDKNAKDKNAKDKNAKSEGKNRGKPDKEKKDKGNNGRGNKGKDKQGKGKDKGKDKGKGKGKGKGNGG